MRRLSDSELTGPLLRAGRALTELSVDEIATRSRLGVATIKRAEALSGPTRMTRANCQALMDAYAEAGLTFCGDEQGNAGVTFRSPREK